MQIAEPTRAAFLAEPLDRSLGATEPLPDLTLIVTTYDRPRQLRRLLTYLEDRSFAGRLHVVDASSETILAENAAAVAGFRTPLPARHIPLPHSTSLADTFKLAVHSVETELLCYCPDDDFVDPGYMAEAAAFLRREPEYVVCGGRFCLATTEHGTWRFTIQSNDATEHTDPFERFIALFESYWPILRSVQRTDAAIDAASNLDAYMHDTVVGEALHGSTYALHGKIHVLDRIGQIQVCHESNNQRLDTQKGFLLCKESFWRAVRILASSVRARLPRPQETTAVDRRLHLAIAHHLASNYWIWRDTAVENIVAAIPGVQAQTLSRASHWLEVQLELDLLRGAFSAATTHEAKPYKDLFHQLHVTPILRIDAGGRRLEDASLGVGYFDVESFDILQTAWQQLREESFAKPPDELDCFVKRVFAPGFQAEYERFRDVRLDTLRPVLGSSLGLDTVAQTFDCLFVIVVLEYLSRFGRHVLPLSQAIAKEILDPRHTGREVAHLEGVARLLFAYPDA